MKRIQIIDSHTGGEPTRVVVKGGPNLGRGTVAEQLKVFRDQHDRFRSAVVNEPPMLTALSVAVTEPRPFVIPPSIRVEPAVALIVPVFDHVP